MGKSRRNRARPRKDPITKAPKPPTDPELAALREKSVLPVIKQLRSSDPKERSAAAIAVSNLVTDVRCRRLFLREQIVHIILTETLTDASIEGRAAGWDILRILVEEEEADFCIHLFRQDALSAVEYAAASSLQALQTGKELGKAETRVLWNTIDSLTALVAAMSEAQDEILEAVVGLKATTALLATAIAHDSAPHHLRLEAVSCLMTLAEDNRRVAEFLVVDEEPKPFSALLQLQAGSGPGRVLACGVLHNVFASLKWQEGSPGNKELSDASLVHSLSAALSDTEAAGQDLPATCQWAKPTQVTQLALEILASIGTSLPESMSDDHAKEEWQGISGEDTMATTGTAKKAANGGDDDGDDGDDGDDDDEDMDDIKAEDEGMDEDDIADIQEDMDMVTGVDDDAPDASVQTDDLSALRALVSGAVPRMIDLAMPAAQTPETRLVQSLALSALNNIAWSVSCFDFSRDENRSILDLWSGAGKDIWDKVIVSIIGADTADIELASEVTSLAWAISRSLSATDLPLQGDEHRKFMALHQASKANGNEPQVGAGDSNGNDQDPLQSLGVKCIGVLGQLALDPAPVALNREIGQFLISVIASLPSSPAADAVEALNQLFDIYGDEEKLCDKEVFWKENMLGHLEQLQPKVKAMAKTIDKRRQQELRSRADEAVLNLGRFIQYKKQNKS